MRQEAGGRLYLRRGFETVRSRLRAGTETLARAQVESARLDAEVLLAAALSRRREDLYTFGCDEEMTEEQSACYQRMLARRARREPVAYIVGMREFWSLSFSVTPGVLIPRPETELLVELALKACNAHELTAERPIRVLDLGAGSGAIAVSLAKERDDVEVWGTDLAPEAVEAATLNARRHGVDGRSHFLFGDLFFPVRGRENFFHVIVSNPPYIRRAEIGQLPIDVRGWEPAMALDGGIDGLDFYRLIVEQAPRYLTDGGCVLVEIGSDLGPEVCRLFAASGRYCGCEIHLDYAQRPRVVSARKAPSHDASANGN